MDKKDIYEHLAKIYLDASVKGKKAKKNRSKFPKPFLWSTVAVLSLVAVFSVFFLGKKPLKNTEVALVVNPDLVKINFNFDPAKKETYAIALNTLNMSGFRDLTFEARRSNYNDKVALRVEFTNAFKEKSEMYLQGLPHKWNRYRIPLAAFKKISDWSEMAELAFIIEEWNTKEKNGLVYIDNVRFLR